MPHLSPMKWCMMLFMFWLIMSMLISTNWWFQTPSWQHMSMSSNKQTHTWKW